MTATARNTGTAGKNGGRSKKSGRRVPIWLKLILLSAMLLLAVVTAIALNRSVEKKTYRLVYPELIAQNAGERQLDPYFVAAVIHVESANDPKALSYRGALGLMQIMPDTGEWIAGKLGETFDAAALTEPEQNIRYGCWYLEFLFERFENSDTVAAAYNAGHNAVRRWLEDPAYSSDGVTLKDIPYEETRNYVEKVKRAYEKYKDLYPKAF